MSFNLEFITETIIPILLRAHCLLVVLSSKSTKEDDEITDWLYNSRYADGRNVFVIYEYLKACPTCFHLGKATTCTHVVDSRPFWQSEQSVERVKALSMNQEKIFQREILNLDVEKSEENAFFSWTVAKFFDKGNFHILHNDTNIPFLITSIDPSDRGQESNYSLQTYAYDPDQARLFVRVKNVQICLI